MWLNIVNNNIGKIQLNTIANSNFNNKNMDKLNFRKPIRWVLSAGFACLFSILTVYAQDTYKLDASSKMTIEGTSTIHDWSSEVTQLSGQAQINMNGNAVAGVNKLDISIPVSSIKGDRSGMDSKT